MITHGLRTAWRGIWRTRASSALAVALIASAIGLNTAIFAICDAILLRKLPVPSPDRLVRINGISGNTFYPVPYGMVQRLRERTDLFAGVSGWSDTPQPVEAGGQTAVALLVRADSEIHRVMGARARIGRLLEKTDRGPVAVISSQFWRERLNGDPQVLGRTVRSGEHVFTIVGVMPEEFSGMNANVSWDVTVPLDPFVEGAKSQDAKARLPLDTVARLRDGVAPEAVRRELQAMWPRLVAESLPPGTSVEEWRAAWGRTVRVESAGHGLFFWRDAYRGPLALLLGMAGLVLLIVSSNVAAVLLVRGLNRQRELAIRAALGAGRSRLVLMAISESLLLALAGAALGLPLARWITVRGVGFLPMGNVPFHYRVGVDARALAFAAVLSLLTGLACGLLPALRTTRITLADAIRNGGTLSPRVGAARCVLVALQVALSALLLTTSLWFAATLAGVSAAPLGFRPEGVLAVSVQGKPPDFASGPEYFDELLRRLRILPGVERASLANQSPMQFAIYGEMGEASLPGGTTVAAEPHCVFPDYFATLGAPLFEGRDFQPRDERATVINEQLRRRLFGAQSAAGRIVRLTSGHRTTEAQVVGVVADVKYTSPREAAVPAFYLACLAQWTPREAGRAGMAIAIRGAGAGLDRAVRQEIDRLGRQYVVRSAPLSAWVGQRILRERMLALLSSVFGAVTLAVAALGLYGMVAFAAASRRREIAIRIALGAPRNRVAQLVFREILLVLAGGLAVGLGAAAFGAKVIASYLFGLRPADPSIPVLAAALLAVTATVAAVVPVRRATSLDPTAVLRAE